MTNFDSIVDDQPILLPPVIKIEETDFKCNPTFSSDDHYSTTMNDLNSGQLHAPIPSPYGRGAFRSKSSSPSSLSADEFDDPSSSIASSANSSGRNSAKPKRKQVKNACVNCQKACKKCDDFRPCNRCVKFGLEGTCADSPRKERKRGSNRKSTPSPLSSSGASSDTKANASTRRSTRARSSRYRYSGDDSSSESDDDEFSNANDTFEEDEEDASTAIDSKHINRKEDKAKQSIYRQRKTASDSNLSNETDFLLSKSQQGSTTYIISSANSQQRHKNSKYRNTANAVHKTHQHYLHKEIQLTDEEIRLLNSYNLDHCNACKSKAEGGGIMILSHIAHSLLTSSSSSSNDSNSNKCEYTNTFSPPQTPVSST